MNSTIIALALATYKLNIKDDLASVEEGKDLTGKIYLKRGKGCLFLKGWTEEVRRKKLPNGRYSMYRFILAEPAYAVKWNKGAWKALAA